MLSAQFIIWRINILSWSVNQCKNIDGDFLEFGCYDGSVAEFLINFCELDDSNKLFMLYDVFDNPPTSKNIKHSDKLYDEVCKKLKKYKSPRIIKGLLPESYVEKDIKKIAYVHFDLNSAETEMKLLEKIYDKISINAHIVIDDYGWKGYEEQHEKHKSFFLSKGQSILELPTGQGIVIKK